MKNKMHGKRERQESAIQRLEQTIAAHESGPILVQEILQAKGKQMMIPEIEKLRKKKIERHKKTIENTKIKLR
jgi:hypothetical protein